MSIMAPFSITNSYYCGVLKSMDCFELMRTVITTAFELSQGSAPACA